MYQQAIRAILDGMGRTDIEASWVEACMRAEWGTLDHLPQADFVGMCHGVAEVLDSGDADAGMLTSLAASYNL